MTPRSEHRDPAIRTESELISLAIELDAKSIAGWSKAESRLSRKLPPVPDRLTAETRQSILRGHDPLGEMFCTLRNPTVRRSSGATLTPPAIVRAMLNGFSRSIQPERIVDPGVGSGRFLIAAGARFPRATLLGIELDPVAAVLARANLAVKGFGDRARIELADFRKIRLPPISGRTIFIGNPPYVRHHLISPEWKTWMAKRAQELGITASKLAGLHLHFYLAAALHSRPGDLGSFITAAEWLDVNYGHMLRQLLLQRLGLQRMTLIDPTARPFPDAATTAVITRFEVGSQPTSIEFQHVTNANELAQTKQSRTVRRSRLEAEPRWSQLTGSRRRKSADLIPLGELFRVHRGQVTGANRIWVTSELHSKLPASVLFRTVTRARELIEAGRVLQDLSQLQFVIDLPVDLDELSREDRRNVDRFLLGAKRQGASEGYVASRRRAWWSVGLKEPAPILATYMARRPPAFVVNKVKARHINIAHGLYPRQPMSENELQLLAEYLSRAVHIRDGRTYAGGLTKFEPREMERLLVPRPELLHAGLKTARQRS